MGLRNAVVVAALFVIGGCPALAQEDPEAVYAKLHRATLAGNTAEVLGFSTAATQAELAAKPQAERDGMIKGLAQVMPKTYTITEKTIAPDGNSAVLRGTGAGDASGRGESYLNAQFVKEGGAWKVSTWGWTNQKPPPPAAKPPQAPANPLPEPKQESKIVSRTPIATPNEIARTPDAPVPAPSPGAKSRGPSRAHLDARACLKLQTNKAIMACAEKYR